MSYLLEFNRYVFRERNCILVFRKVGTYTGSNTRVNDWEVEVHLNEKGYWQAVSQAIIDTQNGLLKRAVSWNDVTTFKASEYARIYTSKLRNAKNFGELLEKFNLFATHNSSMGATAELLRFSKVSNHTYHLKSAEDIHQWIDLFQKVHLQFNTNPANYFTRRGSI